MRYFQLMTSSKFNLKILYTMQIANCLTFPMCFKGNWPNLIYLLTLLWDNLWSTLNFVSSNEKINSKQWFEPWVSWLVKPRKYCCRNKIAFRKQELFFKTVFAILRNTGFCLQHMQAKKRKHIGNNEETVTLNIWYGKFSHLYAVTTPTEIQSIKM